MSAAAPPAGPAAADRWLTRFRARLVAVLGAAVAGIAALAFYTSFEAIKQYANGSNGIDPHHDWAVPLLVDSFIVVATGADLWFSTTQQARRLWEVWWPKALLAGAVGVSFALNIAHVQHADWPARGVAAIPPAALVLGVELLMLVLRRATTLRVERLQAASVPPGGPGEVPPAAVTVSRTDSRPAPAGGTLALPAPTPPGPGRDTTPTPARATSRPKVSRPPAAGSKAARMRAHVQDELAAGHQPEGAAVARRFGVDPSLGRRAVREARAALASQALAAGNGQLDNGADATDVDGNDRPTTTAPPAAPDSKEASDA